VAESGPDGFFWYVEQFGKISDALDAAVVGGFQEPFGHQDAAGEVVGEVFGERVGERCCGFVGGEGVAAVVEDVFELVEDGESLSSGWLAGVEGDDPVAVLCVPVAGAGHGVRGQVGIVLDGDSGLAGDGFDWNGYAVDAGELQQLVGLQFGDPAGFAEMQPLVGQQRPEAG
jgi:hypothetical protein